MQDYTFSPNQVIQDFICQQLLKWQDIKKTKQNNCMNVTEKLKVAENYKNFIALQERTSEACGVQSLELVLVSCKFH